MTNDAPTPAEELALIDRELARLDTHRQQLLVRRAWLVAALSTGPSWRPAPPPKSPRAGETSPPGAQNVLLVLGGVLLSVAAIAFTLVSWGRMGIGGRAAVLGTVTVAALAVPVLLLKRRLASTAESVAALGLVLTVLDAYAVHRVALPGTDGSLYAAWAAAGLAALWTGYGLRVRTLRLPLPAAAAMAQTPLVLWAATGRADAIPLEWALLATAALDLALLLRVRNAPVRVVAALAGAAAGALALLLGLARALAAGTPGAALSAALFLASVAAVALTGAWRLRRAAVVLAAAGGLALVAGAGAVARETAPDAWAVPVQTLAAVALASAVLAAPVRRAAPRLPRPVSGAALRTGLLAAAAAVQGLAVLVCLPLVLLVLTGPLTVVTDLWSGAPESARAALGTEYPPLPAGAAVAVLLAVALLPALGARRLPVTPGPDGAAGGAEAGSGTAERPVRLLPSGRAAAAGGAFALVWGALLLLPVGFGTGYAVALGGYTALAVAALVPVVRPGRTGPAVAGTALGCALATASGAGLLSLATRPATFTVLGVLTAALTAAAVSARSGPAVRAVTGCAAVLFSAGLLVAVSEAAGGGAAHAGLLLLVVPAAVAVVAGRLGRDPLAPPLEATAAAVALLGAGLTAERPPLLALALALCGVIASGTALRPERRRPAGIAAAVLFVLAGWVRLAASGVDVVEAYTLPVSVLAVAVGAVRRRGEPELSSWTAYGPGLAATLLPSLWAAWGDGHWLRPLLLGVSALAVTLTGARLRLQAPLLLGGSVLALVALHELAPYVVQVVDALPRWLPPALAGLLLLAVGATYEQRLRDARRLRDTLGRMG
jgi:hypothetical protein